ncbi:MAG: hypothetical protein A3E87_02030 [Gammaproteobacteria bacterium RIFCSPHIGHO2_12_FULL_35_23]|nr:MAG: hypothetical protein A3E87_02030 [Gammaproteobacteria bacterium RIFCSPHIGHO2_12_FULL_35_23]
MSDRKKHVVIFADYYLPGYKAGGPIRSLSALVTSLQDQYQFTIITRNHDFGELTPYQIIPNTGHRSSEATIYYLDKTKRNFFFYYQLLKKLAPDVVYLNSFFSFRFSLLPLLSTKFLNRKNILILLAPRGEFSPGALAIKSIKKKIYLSILKWFYRQMTFHATGEDEAHYIRQYFNKASLRIATNQFYSAYLEKIKTSIKQPGNLKIIYLSRITKKKNLIGVLRLLTQYPLPVSLDIYGPLEDEAYWKNCQKLIQNLSDSIKINYLGSVDPQFVGEKFSQYDVFLFLTHGENFGHVILEALAAGCPVLLSQATPWKNLEQNGAGWCYHEEDFAAITAKLKELVAYDQAQYQQLINNAKAYAKQYTCLSSNLLNENLFKNS